ncbi:hypothetical protein ACHAXT_003774 [Thalassiosira profunda]
MNWGAWAAPDTTPSTPSHAQPHRHRAGIPIRTSYNRGGGFPRQRPFPPTSTINRTSPSPIPSPEDAIPAYGDSDLPAPSRVIVPATTVRDEQQPRIGDLVPPSSHTPGRKRQIRASGEGRHRISKGGNHFQGCLQQVLSYGA